MSVVVADPATTPGLVCAHHHLYSALARGMPAPPRSPASFLDILEMVWWRLDVALDLETLAWSARLGALEALECGTTAIIDHHESPHAIEGSLDVIADACAEVGVRVLCAYGVTDRWLDDGTAWQPEQGVPKAMTDAARRGLDEGERFVRSGGRGMIGVHAAFTCSDETLDRAAGLARDLGVGVHVHVAEGEVDREAASRLARHADDRWLLVHGVHLDDPSGLPGTLVHNPRSNMNNAVGYARPARFPGPVALGTDGIGGDMVEEFRIAFARLREDDVAAAPDSVWSWLATGWDLVPEARADLVRWSYAPMDPWRLAYTTGVRPVEVQVGGETVLADGVACRVDPDEIRAKAAEAAVSLFRRL